MKNIVLISLIAAVGWGFALRPKVDTKDTLSIASVAIENATYLSPIEREMLQEINVARTQPKIYLGYVKQIRLETVQDSAHLSTLMRKTIKKKVVYENYNEVVKVDTVYSNYYDSKVVAMTELIKILETAPSLNPLHPDELMYQSAKKHGDLQAKNGYIDHKGLDGSWPVDRLRGDVSWVTYGDENIASGVGSAREIVLQLLINSGAEKRGGRKKILNPKWTHFSCYNVASLNKGDFRWWIQEFAY